MNHWKPFSSEWLRWFKKETGKDFSFKNVNGQCAYVADLYRKFLGRGKNQYGFFLGEVTHPLWIGPPFQRHGWLRVGNHIIDPTRWCFLVGEEPLLFSTLVTDTDYDRGMARTKLAINGEQPMPEFNRDDAVECKSKAVNALFNGEVCKDRMFWLANLNGESRHFKSVKHRKSLLLWIVESGQAGLIPIDERHELEI